MLDILVSQGEQSHISSSIHSMNSHLCSMHVSNSAVFFRTSKLWQLNWESWRIYKSGSTHFLGLVCWVLSFFFFSFFISWNPYFLKVHRVSNPSTKVNVFCWGSHHCPRQNQPCFCFQSFRTYFHFINYMWPCFLVQCFITLHLVLSIIVKFLLIGLFKKAIEKEWMTKVQHTINKILVGN